MIGITRYRSFIPIGLRTFILRKFFCYNKRDLTQVLIRALTRKCQKTGSAVTPVS